MFRVKLMTLVVTKCHIVAGRVKEKEFLSLSSASQTTYEAPVLFITVFKKLACS